MKILIMNAYFSPFRGGETIAYNTYKMLKENGHEVIYMAADRKPFFESNYEYSKYFIKDITSIKEYLRRPWAYYYNFEARNKVSKLLNDFKPDLVHVHNIITCFSPAVLEVLKNTPTIMTVHDTGIVCPASTLMYKNKHMCNELYCKNGNVINCLLNKCDSGKLEASFRKTLRAYFINKNLKYVDKFVAPSQKLKDLLLTSGIHENEVDVINNFLTIEEYNTIPNYSNKNYFLYIGSLAKEKGVHYLLQAMNELPKSIELHIAGTGNMEQELKQFAVNNNLSNIKFLGFLDREKTYEELQNCIATILPCNWFENFPTTILESFINGKPVIASNIGGIPEQIEHNRNGFLFEVGNVTELKKCILNYAENPLIVQKHGQQAYEKAIEKYSSKRYYEELIFTYQKVITECINGI